MSTIIPAIIYRLTLRERFRKFAIRLLVAINRFGIRYVCKFFGEIAELSPGPCQRCVGKFVLEDRHEMEVLAENFGLTYEQLSDACLRAQQRATAERIESGYYE